jgi:hypothetical protein
VSLYGVTPADPATHLATVAVLGAVAIVAAFAPIRRATGIARPAF